MVSSLSRVLLFLVLMLISLRVDYVDCDDKPEEKKEKASNVKIKIVDSPASRISPLQSSKELTLRVKPANISGPPHLQQLAGVCFSLTEGGYKYQVCPFYNVTQKEERLLWNSFHGVLGVWREWIIENDTFTGMHFVMGQECSVGDREVKVLFNCSTMTRLHNASEPTTCHYIVWMDTPLACFKGAMQVYHVLSPDQLKEWEQMEYEYFADEITFQGLTKRRRKLLTRAGLLFDNEKEKQRLAEEKRKREGEEKAREKEKQQQQEDLIMPNHLFKSPLTSCEEERDRLRKELDELTEKIHGIVKDFPAVAYRLGFLQNFTHTQVPSTVTTSDPVITEKMINTNEKVEVRRENEAAVDSDRDVEHGTDLNLQRDTEWVKHRTMEGFDELEDVEEDQLEDILKEINEEVEERDMMELKRELVELHKPDHLEEQHAQRAEGERKRGAEDVRGREPAAEKEIDHLEEQHAQRAEGERKRGAEDVRGREPAAEKEIDLDEQLLEMVEQMKNTYPQEQHVHE